MLFIGFSNNDVQTKRLFHKSQVTAKGSHPRSTEKYMAAYGETHRRSIRIINKLEFMQSTFFYIHLSIYQLVFS